MGRRAGVDHVDRLNAHALNRSPSTTSKKAEKAVAGSGTVVPRELRTPVFRHANQASGLDVRINSSSDNSQPGEP